MSDEQTGTDVQEPTGEVHSNAGGAPTAQDAASALRDAVDNNELSEADLDRFVTVTVNGKPQRVKARDVISNYSLRSASHQKFEEAARIRKEAEAEREHVKGLVELLRDPDGMVAVAAEMGLSLQQLRDRINRELETPDDVKRMRDIERRERALQEREQAEKAKRDAARQEAETRAARERYLTEINEAATAAGLPKTPVVVRAMAQFMRAALDSGVSITAAEAAASVREELTGLVGGIVKDSDADHLRTLLGDKLDMVRKAEVDRAVAHRNATRPGQPKRQAPPSQQAKPKRNMGTMSPEEYSAYLDSLQRGRG